MYNFVACGLSVDLSIDFIIYSDLQLEAHKNGCASAQAECVTERARGIEALNMQGGVLHNYIGRLQSSVARVQGNQADLEEQLRRLEIERGFHGQGL